MGSGSKVRSKITGSNIISGSWVWSQVKGHRVTTLTDVTHIAKHYAINAFHDVIGSFYSSWFGAKGKVKDLGVKHHFQVSKLGSIQRSKDHTLDRCGPWK